MKIGEEVLIKAKVVGLANGSIGSEVEVEIDGFVYKVGNQQGSGDWRGSERCGRVKFWVHALD